MLTPTFSIFNGNDTNNNRSGHSAIKRKPNMDVTVNLRNPHYNHHQHPHINQLMTTAAAGTGVVNDVDALAVPPIVANPLSVRPERNLWRTDEILQMLNIMQRIDALELLNDKTIKSEKVFRNIEAMMRECGYRKKTHVQIWTKWKFLKSTYTTTKRNGVVPKMIAPPVYVELHKMLRDIPVGPGHSRRSSNSNCDDSITLHMPNLFKTENRQQSVGSAPVENGFVQKHELNSEEENSFGMAHPIFGFRLGPVKAEPVDAGYETITNNCARDSFEDNMPHSSGRSSVADNYYQKELKQEPNDDMPPLFQSTLPFKPYPPLQQKTSAEQNFKLAKFHAGTAAVSITPIPPLVPNNTVTVQAQASSSQAHTNNAPQFPPLRIAQFAKEPNPSAMLRPLPPPQEVAMTTAPAVSLYQKPSRPKVMTNYSNHVGKDVVMKKLLPKPHMEPQGPMQYSKDMTVQTKAPAMTTPRANKMPARTPRNLNVAESAPELVPTFSPFHGEVPASFAGMQTLESAAKPVAKVIRKNKRISNIAPKMSPYAPQNGAYPNKFPKMMQNVISPQPFINETAIRADEAKHEYDDEDEEISDDYFSGDDSASRQRASFNAAQQREEAAERRKREEEVQERLLDDLSTSLREMHHEVMVDFFGKQMEFVRKQHEFQLRQNAMLMQAFQDREKYMWSRIEAMVDKKLQKQKCNKRKRPNNELANNNTEKCSKVPTASELHALQINGFQNMQSDRNITSTVHMPSLQQNEHNQERSNSCGSYEADNMNKEAEEPGVDNLITSNINKNPETTQVNDEQEDSDSDDSDDEDDSDSDSDSESSTDSDSDDNNNNNSPENGFAEDGETSSEDNDDSTTDPSQLVSSELVEYS